MTAGALLVGSASPAAAVFPAPADGAAVYTQRGEIWLGHWTDSGLVERQLTRSGGTAHSPRWSPDGTRVLYQAGDRLRVMRADGSAKRTVVVSGAISATWVPMRSGKPRIGFVLDNGSGRGDIFTVAAGGGEHRRVTRSGPATCEGDSSPDWSGDGTWLTFTRMTQVGETCRPQRLLRNRVTGRVTVLPESPSYLNWGGPADFDPSSRAVTWLADEDYCFTDLVRYDIDTGTLSTYGVGDDCDGMPYLLQYSLTPSGGSFEYTSWDSEDDPEGWDCYRLNDRTACDSGNAARYQFDIQPLRASKP